MAAIHYHPTLGTALSANTKAKVERMIAAGERKAEFGTVLILVGEAFADGWRIIGILPLHDTDEDES
jgi:hypothetical protein